MEIRLKRAYEPAAEEDGLRVLVERLWPRGLSRERAAIDLWIKDLAPSTDLRRWYGHASDRWEEFRSRYFAELDRDPDAIGKLRAHRGTITFVFASREERRNSAAALRDYLTARR